MDAKKDINISLNSQDAKNALIIKVFEKDDTVLFLYKKIERIVAALYLVTGVMNESDNLRREIRKKSLEILEKSLLLGTASNLKAESLSRLAVDLIHLISLLNVTFLSGLFSEMNFIVIKKEIDHLVDLINNKYPSEASSINRDTLLDREFFMVPSHQFSGTNSTITDQGSNKGGTGLRRIGSWTDLAKLRDDEYKTKEDSRKDGGMHHNGPIKDTSSKSAVSVQVSSDRRARIIDLLKSKDRLMIKDFLSVVTGVSEKTIQRELLKMVAMGVLKKEGERRWSRYSIA